MQITQADLADIPALCDLLKELFTQEAEFSPDYQAQSRGLTRIIECPDMGSVLVARQHERVVGMVTLLYTVSTALGERVALLEDFVVTGAKRGSGIGSQLLDYAVLFAQVKGCRRITLLTDSDNLSAQRFYAKQGFKPSSMLALRLNLANSSGSGSKP